MSNKALKLVQKHLQGKHPQSSHAGGRGGGIYMPGRVASGSKAAKNARFQKNKSSFEAKLIEARDIGREVTSKRFSTEEAFGKSEAELMKSNAPEFAKYTRGLVTTDEFAAKIGKSLEYATYEARTLPETAKQAVRNNQGKSSGDYMSFLDKHSDQSLTDWAHLTDQGLAKQRDDNIVQLTPKFDKIKPHVGGTWP